MWLSFRQHICVSCCHCLSRCFDVIWELCNICYQQCQLDLIKPPAHSPDENTYLYPSVLLISHSGIFYSCISYCCFINDWGENSLKAKLNWIKSSTFPSFPCFWEEVGKAKHIKIKQSFHYLIICTPECWWLLIHSWILTLQRNTFKGFKYTRLAQWERWIWSDCRGREGEHVRVRRGEAYVWLYNTCKRREKEQRLRRSKRNTTKLSTVLKSALPPPRSFIPSSSTLLSACAPQLFWMACTHLPTQERGLWLHCEIKAGSLLL